MKALVPPYKPVICDYVIDELHRKFDEKDRPILRAALDAGADFLLTGDKDLSSVPDHFKALELYGFAGVDAGFLHGYGDLVVHGVYAL